MNRSRSLNFRSLSLDREPRARTRPPSPSPSSSPPPPAFPTERSAYRLLEKIGAGVSAVVYKAACVPVGGAVVAVKSIDLERARLNLNDLRLEAKSNALLSHPNILTAHCSFTVDSRLWVVMPFMSAGSLHSIISSSFPAGLPEPAIAVVLRDTLLALHYLHAQGHLHRDIKAGNILVHADGSIKLADFGVSASIYDQPSTFFSDLAGTPYWMAPEVIHARNGYGFKADIWSLGITAMELAHGRPPLSHLPPARSLVMRITGKLRLDEDEKGKPKKKFSKQFQDMVASCLMHDPAKRPSAEKLLKHPFFKNCKSQDYLVKHVLQGLPTVEKRFKESLLGIEEEEDEEDGGGGRGKELTKSRRISGWNFNEDVLELYPIFPDEEKKGKRSPRLQERVQESAEEESKESEEVEETPGGVDASVITPGLVALMTNMNLQQRVVRDLLTAASGRTGVEEQQEKREEELTEMVTTLQNAVDQLQAELEEENRKNASLEEELRRTGGGGGGGGGGGSSEEAK